jgi:LPS export ABC transporter permease LptF
VRILTRYILGEILSLTLIGCALFTFILFMPQLPHILEVVVRNSSTWVDVAEVFLFTLPNLFKFTIPMAVLWGVLLGLSRLAADSEIIAMRASGLGVWYFVRVASIVAVTGTLLGLGNSLYLAPRANQAIIEMEQALETSQASYEIEPRVFYEDFKNFVLYVQDVRAGAGAANWRQVFMADVSDRANPVITTAASATVVNDNSQELIMRLRNGLRDETVADEPGQSNISTFTTTDMPLALSPQSDVNLGHKDTKLYAMPMNALFERIRELEGKPDQKGYLIEMYNRFALPVACVVLMLLGVPLGVNSRRGGKSAGFVFTILLVFVYYFLSSTGIQLGHQSRLPAFIAVWAANILFAAAGIFLLWQMATGGRILSAMAAWTSRLPRFKVPSRSSGFQLTELLGRFQPRARRARPRSVFPRILDEYILREFLSMFALVLAGFVLLMIVFTFFDLVGDILRNHTALSGGRVPAVPDAEHALPHYATGGADCSAGHVRRDEPQQRNHRHQGHGNQPLPVDRARLDHGRGAGGGFVHVRPVLSAAGQPQTRGAAQPDQGPAHADLPASRAKMDHGPQAAARRAGTYLLLRVLRSRPQ